MSINLQFLGGAGELGANSTYLYLDGTGILIDSGLHPKKRDSEAFPHFEWIEDNPVDLLILTHAHTDHIGALPYLLKFQPQIKIISTFPTCDLVEIMLKDTAKLLQTNVSEEFPKEALSLYQKEHLEKIWMLLEGRKYFEKFTFDGHKGLSPVDITFYPAGHILGSASILIESHGKSILHTGDVNFSDQAIISGADLPKFHLDCLITECTNAGDNLLPDFNGEKLRLGNFINKIADKNGPVLIPAFALGKTQEILKVIYDLMHKGKIPNLPVYTVGLGEKISLKYDRYCFDFPMVNPGFEVSDIPQIRIKRTELFKGDYFKESSIVIVPSGMMNKGTYSYELACRWTQLKNYGIAFIGYLDEDTPGYALSNSQVDKELIFGTKKIKNKCEIGKFRFSSHASLDDLVYYIDTTKPEKLFIVHGDQDSSENLASIISERQMNTEIIIPKLKNIYNLL